MIGVTVLGSTGTIGEATLAVLAEHPDRFEVVALGARRSVARLLAQCERHRPRYAVLTEPAAALELQRSVRALGLTTEVLSGETDLVRIAALPEAPYVMAGIVGAAGLRSSLAAARAGQRLMLANKESLVMAGTLLVREARLSGATLLPIDSEHNAIFQCMPHGSEPGVAPSGVKRLLLTASGGPFVDWTHAQMQRATPDQACAHPRWVMGRKISVDSATLMNKGLEVIEAHILFGLGIDRVEVMVHRQSIVHSLVEYVDGSVLAQLGSPDMRTPIAHALAWPDRIASGVQFLDLLKVGRLDFEAPDRDRFPCLDLAQGCVRTAGLAPVVLNAANEVAVAAFLGKRVNFMDIAAVIESVLEQVESGDAGDLEQILAVDALARVRAHETIAALQSRRGSGQA